MEVHGKVTNLHWLARWHYCAKVPLPPHDPLAPHKQWLQWVAESQDKRYIKISNLHCWCLYFCFSQCVLKPSCQKCFMTLELAHAWHPSEAQIAVALALLNPCTQYQVCWGHLPCLCNIVVCGKLEASSSFFGQPAIIMGKRWTMNSE